MPRLNPENILVLCLDIDQTLMNSKTLPHTLVDFNGSNEYGDASIWLNLIGKMQRHCATFGIQLVVQVITAKVSGHTDDTVDRVAKYFSSVLVELRPDGSFFPRKFPFRQIDGLGEVPAQYHAMRHVDGGLSEQIIYDNREDLCVKKQFPTADLSEMIFEMDLDQHDTFGDEFLPAIHICYRNHPVTQVTSKACVMQRISCFLRGVPAENMFLLDDANELDLISGAGGLTPAYQHISAKELARLSADSKENRTLACQLVLAELESRLFARVADIVNNREVIYHFLNRYSDQVPPKPVETAPIRLNYSRFFTLADTKPSLLSHEKAKSIFSNRDELAQCLGLLLQKISSEQDAIHGAFTLTQPVIPLQTYVMRLVQYLKYKNDEPHDSHESTFILMLIYIDRYLRSASSLKLNSCDAHRVVLACLQLAHKVHDDDSILDKSIANIGGVTLIQLKTLEKNLLAYIQFDAFVPPELFESYRGLISAYQFSLKEVVPSITI